MIHKKFLKRSIDLVLAGLMLFLLSYPITRGLFRHGVAGLVFLGLVLLHHGLNWQWHRSLARARRSARGWVALFIDLGLLAAFLTMLVSCAYLVSEIFPIELLPMEWWARSLHNASAAWLFILGALHLGFHWAGLWKHCAIIFGKGWAAIALLLCCIGVYYFAQSGLAPGMIMEDARLVLPETEDLFFLEYLAIALGFYLIPGLLSILPAIFRK